MCKFEGACLLKVNTALLVHSSEPGFHSVPQADPKLMAILLPQHPRARVISVSHHYLSFLLDEPERSPKAGLCISHLHFLTPTSVGSLLLCILFVLPSPFTSISRCVQNILYQRRMCRNYCDTPFSFPEAANPSRVCLHLSLIYPHASVTGFSNLLLN